MTPLDIGGTWSNQSWNTQESGGGTTSVTNGILTTQASGGDRAYRKVEMPVKPGQRVLADFLAKEISGNPGVAMDLTGPNGTNYAYSEVNITSQDWSRYQLQAIIPPATDRQVLRASFGIFGGAEGEAKYQVPRFHTRDGYGAEMVVAKGLIEVDTDAGLYRLNDGFHAHGVDNISFNGTDELTVTLTRAASTLDEPTIHVTGDNFKPEVPMAGGADSSGGQLSYYINWSDGTSFVDIGSQNNKRFVWMKVGY